MESDSLLQEVLNLSLDSIEDPKIKEAIRALFNLIEHQAQTIREQAEENQRLRDEINRLRGEQGKPNIKARNHNQDSDISSEEERKRNKQDGHHNGGKDKKNLKIKIDRTEVCPVDI